MEGKETRQKLLNILGNNLEFSKDFDSYAERLKPGMIEDLIAWAERCRDGTELGSVPKKKEFKNLYIFFRKIASDTRAVLIKEQNSDFIQVILDNHKAYDDTRMRFGYKISSYYGS